MHIHVHVHVVFICYNGHSALPVQCYTNGSAMQAVHVQCTYFVNTVDMFMCYVKCLLLKVVVRLSEGMRKSLNFFYLNCLHIINYPHQSLNVYKFSKYCYSCVINK